MLPDLPTTVTSAQERAFRDGVLAERPLAEARGAERERERIRAMLREPDKVIGEAVAEVLRRLYSGPQPHHFSREAILLLRALADKLGEP